MSALTAYSHALAAAKEEYRKKEKEEAANRPCPLIIDRESEDKTKEEQPSHPPVGVLQWNENVKEN